MRSAPILIGLMAAGCAPVAATESGGSACNATPAQALIGQSQTEAVAEQAKRLSGATTLRWLPPGAMATMDFRADRLNLDLDAAGRIVTVRCG